MTTETTTRTLEQALAHLAECRLATVEQLRSYRSTSKADIRRQRAVADEAVEACRRFGLKPLSLIGRATPHLAAELAEAASR